MHERMAKLLKQQEQQRAALERELAAAEPFMPYLDGYCAPRVFAQRHETWVSVREERSEVLRKEGTRGPDRALCEVLLSAFPPLRVFKWSDGCCTHLSPDGAEKIPDDAEEIGAILLDVDPNAYSQRVTLRWWTRMPDGSRVSVALDWPIHDTHGPNFGTLQIHTRTDQQTGGLIEYTQCDLTPANGATRIRWSSGGREYANKFTICHDNRERSATDWCALLWSR